MNALVHIKKNIFSLLQDTFGIDAKLLQAIDCKLNLDKDRAFGDISSNAAMVLAKTLGKNPRLIGQEIIDGLKLRDTEGFITAATLAGPGFINITLSPVVWHLSTIDLYHAKEGYFKLNDGEKKSKYLIEFVSANPTGPLHLGHGRGGIIGDVLARVLMLLGHTVDKEFYINDAGNQIALLGRSFKIRCLQELGQLVELPEGGYQGEYLKTLAHACVALHGKDLSEKDDHFFEIYAKNHLLEAIELDLKTYGIEFDRWFSEKTIHENGAVADAMKMLENKGLAYESEGALWFKSTEFGDDKDRVIRKTTGELTYIAGDIAYHKNKFDRGYDYLIDILGQDHHGYVKRLKATMQALGYDADKLEVILYQLVTIKHGEEAVRMSKRAGTFTTLIDIIDAVGADVARFFYLNRKADAHLEFDLATALKKTDENPVFYIQYAYVRIGSIIAKAADTASLAAFVHALSTGTMAHDVLQTVMARMSDAEVDLLIKLLSLYDIIRAIASTHQTHMLAYYAWELANKFHAYYALNRVVDETNVPTTELRLMMVYLVKQNLELCLQLLGISRPEKM